MKKILIFITVISSIILMTTSCEKNDSLDDNAIIGPMAPHAYWEIGSSTVKAGENVPFLVQYYTTGDTPIDHLEVWYNVVEIESKTVSCPWTQTFTYQYSFNISGEKRIAQKVAEYAHQENFWNDSLRAYTFNNTFPTSPTLSSIDWKKPTTFDSTLMIKYFGEGFMESFKDSVYIRMKAVDFQKMYEGLGLVDNFKATYLDSTYNDQTGNYDFIFKGDTIPQQIKDIYQEISFEDLIYNASNNNYEVEFSRNYELNAQLKVIDRKGEAGLTDKITITLN